MPLSVAAFFRYAALVLLFVLTAKVHAEGGKELFQKHCSSCHTIGGGDSGGPDLKGVASRRSPQWLQSIITDPGTLTAKKDPVQLELVKRYGFEMPKLGISAEDAQSIIAFLEGGGAAQPEAKENAPAEAPSHSAEVVVTRALLAEGYSLFTGRSTFSHGGPPCVSCHGFRYPGITGGRLAGDLTDIYDKMGESGVRGILNSLSLPIMRGAYAQRPLKDDEVTALTALFKDAAVRDKGAAARGGKPGEEREMGLFPLAGVGILVLLLAGAALYQRRMR